MTWRILGIAWAKRGRGEASKCCHGHCCPKADPWLPATILVLENKRAKEGVGREITRCKIRSCCVVRLRWFGVDCLRFWYVFLAGFAWGQGCVGDKC